MVKPKLLSYQPMVFFWLGLLTGALIVALLFLYGVWRSQDGKASLFFPSSSYTLLKSSALNTSTGLINHDDPGPWIPTSTKTTTLK